MGGEGSGEAARTRERKLLRRRSMAAGGGRAREGEYVLLDY